MDGKPRVVAVDDWIPGSYWTPAFAKPVGYTDKDFWAIILEKAWAKIYGTYMRTEGGWHEEVWYGLTGAPVNAIRHSNTNAAGLYDTIKDKFSRGYPVGTATVLNAAKNLV